ncbi:MAG: class I SAM-dependent methyltransferase [Prevotella sp.]|nr:class I SAM-dependent methyltransferase [Prevotella sp.]
MNPQRKAKLKSMILKLPLGAKILELRRKIIAQRQKCRRKKISKKEKKLRNSVQAAAIALERQIEAKKTSLKYNYRWLWILRLTHLNYYYRRIVQYANRFKTFCQFQPEDVTVFEIGTGPAVGSAIGLSLIGFKQIITVDIRRANPKFVQMTCQHYRKYAKKLGLKSVPKIKERITDENLDEILRDDFNIDYRVPYDAAHTDLPDNSVGYVNAELVFNFIRVEILTDMIKEAFRILRGGG